MDFNDDINNQMKRNSTTTEFNEMFSTLKKISEPEHSDFNNSSIFGDGSCGEPLLSQHLVLDFTPLEEIDNDFVQQKCCAFWDFVRSHPEFDDWMTMPESNGTMATRSEAEGSVNDGSGRYQKESDDILKDPTAISMLEIVEKKGLIDRTFEAKMPQCRCSLGSIDYQEDDTGSPWRSLHTKRVISACSCEGKCESCNKKLSQEPVTTSTLEVRAMCEKMNEWDVKHSRSMEPPGQPPALTKCIM